MGSITLSQYATDDLPPLGELSDGALPRARVVLQRLLLLYQRTLARLAVIALSAEQTAARSAAPQSVGGIK